MGLFLHYCNFLVIFLPKNCINEINNPQKRISTMFWKIAIMKFAVMKFGKILIYFVLKSVYFKKTVARICGTFNTNQNKKYHNFNRNEICTTVFLKWLDFISPIKKIEAIYSVRDFFCVGSEIFWPLKVTTKYWVMVGFSDSIDLVSGKQGKTSK